MKRLSLILQTARQFFGRWPQTVTQQLLLTFGTTTCAVLLAATWINYFTSRSALEEQLNLSVVRALEDAARKLDLFVQICGARCEPIAARELAAGHCPPDEMRKFLVDLLHRTPPNEAFDFYITYENMDYRNPDSDLVVDRLSWPATYCATYDYHEPRQEWFYAPKMTHQAHVTEPYYDLGSVNQSMVSYTIPLLDSSNQFLGVVGVDILLDAITNIVGRIEVLPGEYEGRQQAFVASRAGRLISHPNPALLPSKRFAGAGLEAIPEGKYITSAPEGFALVRIAGERRRIYWASAPFTKWKIAINVSEPALIGPVNALTRQMAWCSVLALAAMLGLIVVSARLFSKPIRALADSTSQLAANLSPALNERNPENEVNRISQSVRKLTDYQVELDRANTELESFSYSVSHDLRAPLRVIANYADILQEDYAARLEADGKQVCDRIRSGVQDMNRLIDNLLKFSRLARAPMEMESVDMSALAAAAFEMVATPPPARPVFFQVGPLPAACGDPVLLRQVWINLLSNAVKFSSRREAPRVEVTGREEKGELIYTVRDNGAGFDPQHAAKLFGVFMRLHSVSEFEGTGLGLAIVQRIVQRHGGRVWAESQPDQGAVFHFTLPKSAPTLKRD